MENRLVYLYTFPNKKQYIGQTKNSLPQRTAQHVYEARNTPEKGCILLNHAINFYNEEFTKEIIIKCFDYEVDFLEKEFIELHGTKQPNGYNIRDGGNNVEHDPEVIAKRAKSNRKLEEDEDMPMYTKRDIKRGKLRWRINNHPLCSSDASDTKEEMLEKLAKYENGELPPKYAVKKEKKTTPDFIYERKNGYVIEYKGECLASILNKHESKDVLLIKAQERLQELKNEGKINSRMQFND